VTVRVEKLLESPRKEESSEMYTVLREESVQEEEE